MLRGISTLSGTQICLTKENERTLLWRLTPCMQGVSVCTENHPLIALQHFTENHKSPLQSFCAEESGAQSRSSVRQFPVSNGLVAVSTFTDVQPQEGKVK